ncbi:T9SS type A sorting domain-containing protein [Adhaeribacter sp. BT258]|uniref:T9SS type A sorting domain-containing protein n=1 Tax=Adhaeribacter terrigena TaxID=2793070 RepID=A0ABS1C0V6_9BACT|nr:T9SS type A sorting domain-containing protein [Adhaeribacter terrigena]MBK0403044.1 T9SS type A sorting domain-containing protein [Adhaeribacter terrigena]
MRKFIISAILGVMLVAKVTAQIASTSPVALHSISDFYGDKPGTTSPDMVSATGQRSVPDSVMLVSTVDKTAQEAHSAVLSWHAFPDATSYQLQVATVSDFQGMVADISNITALSYTVSGLTHNTQYFWRVKAFIASGESNWSAARSFSIGSPPSSPATGLQGTTGEAIAYHAASNTSEASRQPDLPVSRPANAIKPTPAIAAASKSRKNAASSRYPAPVSNINFIIPAQGDYTLTLHDLSGKPVCVLKQGYANSRESLTVDLKEYNLPDGMYMVKLFASKSSQQYLRVKVGD